LPFTSPAKSARLWPATWDGEKRRLTAKEKGAAAAAAAAASAGGGRHRHEESPSGKRRRTRPMTDDTDEGDFNDTTVHYY